MPHDDFDEISLGGFLRGRDLVGHWVVFVVKNTVQTEGTFGKQTIATVDFIDLSDKEPELQQGMRISDQYIVEKLQPGKKIVGLINRSEPKKKGWQGAIFLEQPKGLQYESAKSKARELLNGERKPIETPPVSDDLEDLLG